MTYKTATYILAFILIIVCILWWKNRPVPPTHDAETIEKALKLRDGYLTNLAGVSSGINFNDGKVTVINNVDGEIVQPCKNGNISFSEKEIYQNTNKPISTKNLPEEKDCNLAIFDLNPDLIPNLEAAQKVSNEAIKAKVRKNGKVVPVTIINQINFVYDGSTTYCIYVGGILRCIKISDALLCKAMGKALLEKKPSMTEQAYNAAKSTLKKKGCVIQ